VDDKGLTGEVIALDGPYGNLITNIGATIFRSSAISSAIS